MSLDIVEIALDNLTDYHGFEKLSLDIMYLEGYHDIRALGGIHDGGRDATEEKLFIEEGKRNTTIFQFTTERNLQLKMEQTISRLDQAEVKFSNLVFVTSRAIGTSTQDKLKKHFREKYGTPIDIYERDTLVNRLMDYKNGLFNRNFPSIEKQIADMTAFKKISDVSNITDFEKATLRSALALTFGNDSEKTRNVVFDNLVMAVLTETAEPKTVLWITDKLSQEIKSTPLPMGLIRGSLERLSLKRFVAFNQSDATLTDEGKARIAAAVIEISEATASLVDDVLEDICETFAQPIDVATRRKISRNIKEVLVIYFQLYGIELSNQFLSQASRPPVFLEKYQTMTEAAKKGIPKEIGAILLNTVGDLLSKPSKEHIKTLTNWSCAYIGIQIMNFDPLLQELESSRLKKKLFILDTDFVLNTIVEEDPLSIPYRKLIQDLLKLGCTVIVPESVIDECVVHAKTSIKTYLHFKEGLFHYDETYIREMVWNVFVKGYYYGYKAGSLGSEIRFRKYLRNYYDENRPEGFFRHLLTTNLPTGVVIGNPATYLKTELPLEQLQKFTQILTESMLQSKKAKYRTKDQNEELAATDARLFLTALYLNEIEKGADNTFFGGNCYLVTSSATFIKAAKAVGIKDIVTTRPQSVVGLLEIIGANSNSRADLVRLFENPFLIQAVKESQDDVKRLVESGIDLGGQSIARLQWDLDQTFHRRLTLMDQADTIDDTIILTAASEKDISNFDALLAEAISRGYRLSPEVQAVLSQLDFARQEVLVTKQQLDEMSQKFDALEEKYKEFGKRKQRYLRRVKANKK